MGWTKLTDVTLSGRQGCITHFCSSLILLLYQLPSYQLVYNALQATNVSYSYLIGLFTYVIHLNAMNYGRDLCCHLC